MMSLHKTLFTISCVSFSLCAMETDTLVTPIITNSSIQPTYNQKNYYPLNSLYKTTDQMLNNYNPYDKQSVTSIFQIIDATTKLQNDGCEEIECGRFAYRQHLQKPQSPMPLHISLVLERIAEHKAHMKKNEFSPPTLEQLMQYINIPRINAAIEKAASFRLIIRNKIDHDTAKLLDSYNTKASGLSEYSNLVHDIKGLLEMSPEDAKFNADLIYGPKL
jgi:hypothetical protein